MEKTRLLKQEIFKLVKTFPKEEKFRLPDQLIRATRSIGVQIAEGHGRKTFPDKLRFCIVSRGSLRETLNHIIDAFDCTYIDENILFYYRNKIDELERLLNDYINYLEKSVLTK